MNHIKKCSVYEILNCLFSLYTAFYRYRKLSCELDTLRFASLATIFVLSRPKVCPQHENPQAFLRQTEVFMKHFNVRYMAFFINTMPCLSLFFDTMSGIEYVPHFNFFILTLGHVKCFPLNVKCFLFAEVGQVCAGITFCQLYDARDGVKKRCHHRLISGRITQCHV